MLDEVYEKIGRRAIALIRVGALDFAAVGSTIGKAKAKNCKKGYSCGFTCIGRGKNCRNPLKGQAKNYADFLAANAKKSFVDRSTAPVIVRGAGRTMVKVGNRTVGID